MPRKEWMTFGLAKSCETKSLLFKAYKLTKTPETKLKYISYRNKLKSLLTKAENSYYTKRMQDCQGNQKFMWNLINSLLNKNRRQEPTPAQFRYENKFLTDTTAIANKFNEYFVNAGKVLASKIPQSCRKFTDYISLRPMILDSCFLNLTNADEVITVAKGLNNSQSSGFDEISVMLLKDIIECVAQPMADILNLCISRGIFPDNMKIAKVCPVFKSSDKREFSNYRPISILPSFSKIFEKIIEQRITSFITKHEIIASSQFGFRKNHSAYMAMLK